MRSTYILFLHAVLPLMNLSLSFLSSFYLGIRSVSPPIVSGPGNNLSTGRIIASGSCLIRLEITDITDGGTFATWRPPISFFVFFRSPLEISSYTRIGFGLKVIDTIRSCPSNIDIPIQGLDSCFYLPVPYCFLSVGFGVTFGLQFGPSHLVPRIESIY